MADLQGLLWRVHHSAGPDRKLDGDLWCAFNDGWHQFERVAGERHVDWFVRSPDGNEGVAPNYTSSLDDVKRLVEGLLPGWWWKVGTCHVSDDACLCPDFNDPVHGARLRARYFPIEHNGPYDGGFDIDRRPPGNLPLALLEALLQALIAEETIQTQRSNAYGD